MNKKEKETDYRTNISGVDASVDNVNCATTFLLSRLDDFLVNLAVHSTGKIRQQGRMNVQDAILVSIDDNWGQDAHEPNQ
jgi:hypothetical protein